MISGLKLIKKCSPAKVKVERSVSLWEQALKYSRVRASPALTHRRTRRLCGGSCTSPSASEAARRVTAALGTRGQDVGLIKEAGRELSPQCVRISGLCEVFSKGPTLTSWGPCRAASRGFHRGHLLMTRRGSAPRRSAAALPQAVRHGAPSLWGGGGSRQ